MHPAGHRIEIDPDREFMRVTLWGDWANAQTDNLSVDHAKAVSQMKAGGARHGHFLTLVDMREKHLTEAVTVAEFRKSFEANSPSRRTAIIVSPPLPTSMAATRGYMTISPRPLQGGHSVCQIRMRRRQ